MGVAISGASTTRRWNVSGTNKLEWRLMADFRIHGPTSVVQAGDAYPACSLNSARSIFSFMIACTVNTTFALRWIGRGLFCAPVARLSSTTSTQTAASKASLNAFPVIDL